MEEILQTRWTILYYVIDAERWEIISQETVPRNKNPTNLIGIAAEVVEEVEAHTVATTVEVNTEGRTEVAPM